jgi:short-subunit dehydrogenase
MVRDLQGRRILITGASSGIGHALAGQAAGAGARVLLTARSAPRLTEIAQKLAKPGTEVFTFAADVTSDQDRHRLVETATQRLGGLDVLVNNAGVASFGHFADSSEAVLRQIMEVNFFAPAELIRLLVPVLARGRQPAIVNVSSMCGRRGLPAWTEYSASKFALCGLSEALRAELVRFGIDVLLVVPGLTRTGLGENLLRNDGRMKIDFAHGMPPDAVAAAVLQSLRCNRSEAVLGGEARWLLRVNRFMPGLLDRLIARKVRRLYASERPATPVAAS